MMRVLLLSRSRVVQELVKLGLNTRKGVELEIVEAPSELRGDHYDFLLLDDRFEKEFGRTELDHLIIGRRILLGKSEEDGTESWDDRLAKPFLPADIRALLEAGEAQPDAAEEGEDLRLFQDREAERSSGPKVLDGEEIGRILRLLDDEEGGEEGETEIPAVFSPPEGGYTVQELLELLDRNRVKKLKKLLRGATIHIRIEFPEVK